MITWIAESSSLGAISSTDRVALIGDSLAVGLAGPLKTEIQVPFEGVAKGGTDIRAWLSGQMASALNNVLAAKPTIVLISLGTNDTAPASQPNAETIKSRVAALVDKVRVAGSTPVWLLPGPLPWSTDALLSSIAATGVRTIAQPQVSKPDKIHPSGEGYKTWAKAIAEDLQSSPSSTGLTRRGGILGGALVIAAAVGLLWATLRVGR